MRSRHSPFAVAVSPNWEAFLCCLRRERTPERVHFVELLLDEEIKEAVAQRFNLLEGIERSEPFYAQKREIRINRFLGYDFVCCGLDEIEMPLDVSFAPDTASLSRTGGRKYINEHKGPIATWKEFDAYPWPDPEKAGFTNLQWYEENLPEDMCVIALSRISQPAGYLIGLMGFETLCYALFDQRELVSAISQRLREMYEVILRRILQFERVKVVWGSDDMGFRSGTLISPDDLRAFVLPAHKGMATIAHAAGRPYLLHSCGKLEAVMDDLLDDVHIDGLHSFEDTIRTVETTKARYGHRIAVLGGIDVDFLCRSNEEAIRRRVRATLEACHSGGGYCLGTGNSVTNYVPLDNYLVMLDEGRRFS